MALTRVARESNDPKDHDAAAKAHLKAADKSRREAEAKRGANSSSRGFYGSIVVGSSKYKSGHSYASFGSTQQGEADKLVDKLHAEADQHDKDAARHEEYASDHMMLSGNRHEEHAGEVVSQEWDESKHARDESGKFT